MQCSSRASQRPHLERSDECGANRRPGVSKALVGVSDLDLLARIRRAKSRSESHLLRVGRRCRDRVAPAIARGAGRGRVPRGRHGRLPPARPRAARSSTPLMTTPHSASPSAGRKLATGPDRGSRGAGCAAVNAAIPSRVLSEKVLRLINLVGRAMRRGRDMWRRGLDRGASRLDQ